MFSEYIKKYSTGLDKEYIIVHNKNVINSVDKTLITNQSQKKDNKMKVNSINSYNYQNINKTNKQYVTRPVFKQTHTDSVISTAILETLVESANDNKRSSNTFMSKINYFKEVLFSEETTRKAKLLKEALESYDSTQNILYKA